MRLESGTDREYLVEETFSEISDNVPEKMTFAERFGLLDREVVEQSVREGERIIKEKNEVYQRNQRGALNKAAREFGNFSVGNNVTRKAS